MFPINLRAYEAYDKNKTPFKIDVVAFFSITNTDLAVQKVSSFDDLKTQLTSVLQGAIRNVLAQYDIERIMQERAVFGDTFTAAVNADLSTGWGVETVKSVELMDISDTEGSRTVANIMAKEISRIEMESRMAVADNLREAELKEIEAKRIVDVSQQDAAQQVGIRTAEKDREVGIATERSNQEVLLQAKETAEREMQVRLVNEVKAAEIAREVQVVAADAKKQTAIIDATALKTAAVTTAEGDKQTIELRAQGQLAAAKNEAEGVRALGEAKAKAEEALQLAPVTAQTTLAKEIGDNQGYQQYLITVRGIEKEQAVGIELAKAYSVADIKIIANGGSVQEGVGGLSNIFNPQLGTAIAGMLTAAASTEEGKAAVKNITKGQNNVT